MLETDFFLYVCIYTIYRINLFLYTLFKFPFTESRVDIRYSVTWLIILWQMTGDLERFKLQYETNPDMLTLLVLTIKTYFFIVFYYQSFIQNIVPQFSLIKYTSYT